MNIFRFLDWKVYEDAKKLNRTIGAISQRFSIDIKKKYYSQFNRAALSVCLNIAESVGRYTDAEMCRFLDFSLGSISELVACADSLKDEKCITNEEFLSIFEQAKQIAKQIQGLQNSAQKHPKIFRKQLNYVE